MKTVKAGKIRELAVAEQDKRAGEIREELFKLRFQHATGHQFLHCSRGRFGRNPEIVGKASYGADPVGAGGGLDRGRLRPGRRRVGPVAGAGGGGR